MSARARSYVFLRAVMDKEDAAGDGAGVRVLQPGITGTP